MSEATARARASTDARTLWAAYVVLVVVSGLVLGRGELLVHRGTGWAAILLLLATLAVSPLARLGRRLGPRGTRFAVAATGARRWLGVTAFGVATVHAALAVLGHLGAAALEIDRYRHGALALALLSPLAMTSSTRLVARVGLRAWKALHRGVYGAVALALLHAARAPMASITVVLVATITGIGLIAARPILWLVARRHSQSP